jgi:hypothetical protein
MLFGKANLFKPPFRKQTASSNGAFVRPDEEGRVNASDQCQPHLSTTRKRCFFYKKKRMAERTATLHMDGTNLGTIKLVETESKHVYMSHFNGARVVIKLGPHVTPLYLHLASHPRSKPYIAQLECGEARVEICKQGSRRRHRALLMEYVESDDSTRSHAALQWGIEEVRAAMADFRGNGADGCIVVADSDWCAFDRQYGWRDGRPVFFDFDRNWKCPSPTTKATKRSQEQREELMRIFAAVGECE